VFGSLGVVCLVFGCCTCGVSFYAAPVLAGLGFLFGLVSQGAWKGAGLTVNLLVFTPAILIVGVMALGAIGVNIPSPEQLRDRIGGRGTTAQAGPKVESQKSSESVKAAEPVKAKPVKKTLKVGDIGILDAGGDVFVAVDQASNDRLTRLCVAKDETGVMQMVAQGRVFVAKSGTKARLIGAGFLTHEVRIVDGKHAGKSGWIAAEHIKPEE
jgi:hypothetical protein